MWSFNNPVTIKFGVGMLSQIGGIVRGRRYCLVTYDEPVFHGIADRIRSAAGNPVLVVNDVKPNPDFVELEQSCARFASADGSPEVIVAVGGGSVMDAAKVLAAAGGDFGRVRRYLETGQGGDELRHTPIIAVPTTAGTGSEMTCWATVWHSAEQKKYSLARTDLYPECAVVDAELMLGLPKSLTISTGLDALSHALESIWNVNQNPISTTFAISAAKDMLEVLPALVDKLDDLKLRDRAAKAALMAGIAFSNTKTALAHNISYPITLRHGVPHGEACSFTLPAILRCVVGRSESCDQALKAIFGDDLALGAKRLDAFFDRLGIPTSPSNYGVSEEEWQEIVDLAFAGERGKNFIGTRERFHMHA